MNCKRIQELILTDYLDDQMDKKEKAFVEAHLANCPSCKEFYMAARKVGPELFVNAGRVNPPEFIWSRVKEAILAGQQKKAGFAADLLGKLRAVMYIPKPAIAIVSVIMLIFAVGTMTKLKMNNYRPVTQQQLEYLDYSMEAPVGVSANGEADFGTLVEKYFL